MYKTISVMLAVGSLLLTGCASNKVKETSEKATETAQESNTYNHQAFSIVLPAPFTTEDGVIKPKKEKDFPTIIFGNSQEKITVDGLPEFTEEWFENLWTQTDPSGEFTNKEKITINSRNGIKFTIQYPGRSYDDPNNGYINEYHYSILDVENLFQFWTSASDMENPDNVSKQFDEIIETISFK